MQYVQITVDKIPVFETQASNAIREESRKVINEIDVSIPVNVIEKEDYMYTIRSDRNVLYLILSDKDVEATVCGKFLSSIRKIFINKFGKEVEGVKEHMCNSELMDQITELMNNENEAHLEIKQELAKLKPIPDKKKPQKENSELVIVNNVGEESNIIKPLPHNERIDTETGLPLAFPEEHFNEEVTTLRMQICWQRYKIPLLIFILLTLIISIILFVCGGISLSKCIPTSKE